MSQKKVFIVLILSTFACFAQTQAKTTLKGKTYQARFGGETTADRHVNTCYLLTFEKDSVVFSIRKNIWADGAVSDEILPETKKFLYRIVKNNDTYVAIKDFEALGFMEPLALEILFLKIDDDGETLCDVTTKYGVVRDHCFRKLPPENNAERMIPTLEGKIFETSRNFFESEILEKTETIEADGTQRIKITSMISTVYILTFEKDSVVLSIRKNILADGIQSAENLPETRKFLYRIIEKGKYDFWNNIVGANQYYVAIKDFEVFDFSGTLAFDIEEEGKRLSSGAITLLEGGWRTLNFTIVQQ